jgi:hypothetical protein
MPRNKLNLEERIRQLKFELMELEEQYKTQLYFETMPEYDPVYTYCFSTSNRTIPYEHQHIDHWIRAVMKHMATRPFGHGGASTSAVLVSVPLGLSDKGVEAWVDYGSTLLKKAANKHKRKKA